MSLRQRARAHLLLPVTALVTFLALGIHGPAANGQSTVVRLAASDAIEAGNLVSQSVFDDGQVDHVILVRDDRFADALVAGPLSGELPGLAPILFTPTDVLPESVQAEINRATGGSGTVHIIGGDAAVGIGVARTLTDQGYVVQRSSGQTRLETALAVFRTYFADDLDGGDVMIARAYGTAGQEDDAWPDAITGGGFGAARGVPILLTATEGVPEQVLSQIREVDAGTALVLGGPAAVSQTAVMQLEDAVDLVVRVAGQTREETGVAVATDLFGIPALAADDLVVLVNGRSSFAFGLAAATLAAAGNGAGEALVLLVTADSPTRDCGSTDEVSSPTACFLSAEGTQPGPIVLVGDTTQISAEVEATVGGLRGQGSQTNDLLPMGG